MLKKGAILCGYIDPNRYSISTLIAAIETEKILLDNYDFFPLNFHLYESNVNISAFQKISWDNYEYVIISFSLLSIQYPLLKAFLFKYPFFFNRFHKKVITIAGGPHAIAYPNELAKLGLDLICVGEGEEIFIDLLKRLLNESIDQLKLNPPNGLAIGTPRYLPSKPIARVQLGKFPPFAEKYRLFKPIEISRGCPFKCKFCQTGNYLQNMCHVPPEIVIQWIKRVVEIKYDKLWFLTPNAFAYGGKNGIKPDITKLHKLLSEIRSISGIKQINFGTFPLEIRPEFISREILEVVKPNITNSYFVIGVQTASNRLLKYINRGHTYEDFLGSLPILDEFGYQADVDFIFGLPTENEEDIQLNLAFFQAVLDGKYPNVKIHTHTFMPLPGTPFQSESVGIVDQRLLKIIGKLSAVGKAHGEYLSQAELVQNRFSKKNA